MWVLLSSDLVISLNETSSNLASQIIPNHYSDFFLFLRVIVICDWTIFVFYLQHFRSRIVCLLCVRYCSIDYNRILNGTMAIIRFSCNCFFSLFRLLWLMWMWVFKHIIMYQSCLCQSFIEFVMSHRYSFLFFWTHCVHNFISLK